MTDEEKVEAVAMRLEDKKRFLVQARETVYYVVEVWATDRDDAWSSEVEDWGDPVDGCDFEVFHVEEVTE
jgi:hypothetical protein